MNGEVHLGHPPGALVELLAVDGNVRALHVVGLEELLGLDEHAARTTAGVIHAPTVRFQYFHEYADYAGRRVELPAALTLGLCELFQEVFVHLSEEVACLAGTLTREPRGVEQVQQLAQAALVHIVPVVDLGERRGQGLVVHHDHVHGLVDELANGLRVLAHGCRQALGVLCKVGPARAWCYPEHAASGVLVHIVDELADLLFVESFGFQLSLNLFATFLERVRHVLKEHQPKDYVLVL